MYKIENKIIKPEHNLFSAFGQHFNKIINFNTTDEDIKKYIKGDAVNVDDMFEGYGVITVQNCPLGGFKMSGGKFKNLYPKGLRC